ncbi:MAG: prepilin-type N-terminal cleavage/methylation domain-containing protein [Phycisphaerae bacterium]|nr:prepilin-type N-terminal cleavage/methylation domain-containing protein [Phycisphaerae bacterium]
MNAECGIRNAESQKESVHSEFRTPNSEGRRRGFTLLELTLSLAISTMVLATAAGLAFAVSHAWGKSEDINEIVSHGRNGLFQISDRVRSGRAIGYTDSAGMLIWREDSNGDGYVDQAELSLLRVSGGQLTEGRLNFGANVSQATQDANNRRVTAGEFVSSSYVASLQQNPYFATGVLCDYVTSVSWVLDQNAPQTRLVQVRIALTKDGLSQTFCGGMSLRSPLEVK